MAKRLTEKGVEALAINKRRAYIVYDAVQIGLCLKVYPSGKKVWTCKLRFPGGKGQSRRRLGEFPGLGVADARARAQAWYDLVKVSGRDPKEVEEEQRRRAEAEQAKAAAKKADTFGAFAETYIAGRTNRRAAKDAKEIRRLLVPTLGARPIGEIAPRDLRQLIDRLKTRAPYDARNAWTHLVQVFKQAVHEEVIEASPAASLDRRLLFKGAKIAPRQRVLDDEELFAFARSAARMGYPYGPAYRLLLLTGTRLGEAAGAKWGEFHPELRRILREAQSKETRVNWSAVDSAVKMWVIPRERFKSDAEHAVPLSDDACAVLESIPRFAKSDLVFTTNGRAAVWIGAKVKAKLDARMVRTLRALARRRGEEGEIKLPPFVNHDIRRTVRTNLSALGVADHVAEAVLGHSRQGLARIYDRHRYLPEIRDALERWAARVREIVMPAPMPAGPEKVIAITTKRRARR